MCLQGLQVQGELPDCQKVQGKSLRHTVRVCGHCAHRLHYHLLWNWKLATGRKFFIVNKWTPWRRLPKMLNLWMSICVWVMRWPVAQFPLHLLHRCHLRFCCVNFVMQPLLHRVVSEDTPKVFTWTNTLMLVKFVGKDFSWNRGTQTTENCTRAKHTMCDKSCGLTPMLFWLNGLTFFVVLFHYAPSEIDTCKNWIIVITIAAYVQLFQLWWLAVNSVMDSLSAYALFSSFGCQVLELCFLQQWAGCFF